MAGLTGKLNPGNQSIVIASEFTKVDCPRYRSLAKRCKIEVCQPDCDALHRELELWHSGEEFGKKALRC